MIIKLFYFCLVVLFIFGGVSFCFCFLVLYILEVVELCLADFPNFFFFQIRY